MAMTDMPHILVSPFNGEVTVRLGDEVVARSMRALALKEGSYGAVYYLPREDVSARLTRSPKRTTCPHKGEAAHFTLEGQGGKAEDAVWSYEEPKAGVAEIAGHVAFYPNRLRIEATPAPSEYAPSRGASD